MDTLPSELLCEICKRVPFQTKQQSLPLVCKNFRQLLNNPPTSSLWGNVTLDFDKVKDSKSPRAVVELVCSMQWLCQRSSAIERVQILAMTDADTDSLVEVCLAVLERSAKRVPALELHIEGDSDAGVDFEMLRQPERYPAFARQGLRQFAVVFCYKDYKSFPEYCNRDWDYFVKEEAQ
ncbi:hypothetical protein WJX72_003613 [[Myrmecia] bisecta]|uniref:F-box domain-containing protein n=1 Tax=[Myrmecia] bisecta TaxID=41462 RepID=A0AAW1PEE6_9CHLO